MNSNKTAIITGASTGIGKHISIKLAENNYNVILISRSKNKLVEVEKKIKSLGKSCQLIVGDISKESTIKNIFSQINEINNIDILINNAGIGIFNKIENISCKEWDQQLDTNLKGSFLMTKYIVPQMIKNKTGKIVFINSIAGINAYPYSSAYVASKFGLRGFSSSLREELREYNIKVISIHPGAVNTPFWNNVKADFPREQMLSSIDVASSIVNAVMAPNNVVQEEIVIRRTKGDF
jgi:3-oxoacyl-[acyl-carrier protein] reductase